MALAHVVVVALLLLLLRTGLPVPPAAPRPLAVVAAPSVARAGAVAASAHMLLHI